MENKYTNKYGLMLAVFEKYPKTSLAIAVFALSLSYGAYYKLESQKIAADSFKAQLELEKKYSAEDIMELLVLLKKEYRMEMAELEEQNPSPEVWENKQKAIKEKLAQKAVKIQEIFNKQVGNNEDKQEAEGASKQISNDEINTGTVNIPADAEPLADAEVIKARLDKGVADAGSFIKFIENEDPIDDMPIRKENINTFERILKEADFESRNQNRENMNQEEKVDLDTSFEERNINQKEAPEVWHDLKREELNPDFYRDVREFSEEKDYNQEIQDRPESREADFRKIDDEFNPEMQNFDISFENTENPDREIRDKNESLERHETMDEDHFDPQDMEDRPEDMMDDRPEDNFDDRHNKDPERF